jgi:hypothetical protein
MATTTKTALAFGFFVLALVMGFISTRKPIETFMQKDAGMPLNGPAMGPYDTSMGGWMSSEHMPVGGLPQNSFKDDNNLMFLVGNTSKPECCPSGFTTDSGCICLTESDSDLMAHRGGNK